MKYSPAAIPDEPKPTERMAAAVVTKATLPMTKSTKTMFEVRNRMAAVFLEIWKILAVESKSATKRVGWK